MLCQVYIASNKEIIYKRIYSKGLDSILFNNILPKIYQDISAEFSEDVGFYDFFNYKISYITDKELNFIIFFVSSLADSFNRIETELVNLKKELYNFYGESIKNNNFVINKEEIDSIIDILHKNLRPKISLVGFAGVGKTTILSLIKAEDIPMEHIPTINGDVAAVRLGKLHLYLWDFAGQEQFNILWRKFIKESDVVLLITNSSFDSIEKSKFFIDLIKEEAPYSKYAIIANKQDLSSAINVETIYRLMGVKTYSMIATKKDNRDKMIKIIADLLEIDYEISPLLKDLFERQRLVEEIQNLLKEGKIEESINYYKRISELSIELGDYHLAEIYQEKMNNFKNFIKKRRIKLGI